MNRRDFLRRGAGAAAAGSIGTVAGTGCAADRDRAPVLAGHGHGPAEAPSEAHPPGVPPLVEGFPPVGRFVEAHGVPVHAWTGGAGPSVVLLHGANGNLRDWTFGITAALARDFRLIVLDRPGFGYTGRPASGASDPAVQARILREAARQLGAELPILVGHSYGGAVAMAWALQAPDEVAGVVSVAGAVMPFGGVPLLYHLGALPIAGGILSRVASAAIGEERVREFVERAFSPQDVPEGYVEHVGAPFATRPATLRATAEDLAALDRHLRRMRPAYRELGVPVEFLHGTADTTVGFHVHSEPLSQILPVARLTRLEGVGHMAHHARTGDLRMAIGRIASA